MTNAIANALNEAGISTAVTTKKARTVKPKATAPIADHKEPKLRTVPAGTVAAMQTGTAFFDPMDTLMDKLSSQPALYSRVLDSMAWMLDASCISQARSILFTRYADTDKELADTFQDFCLNVHSQLKHDSLYTLEAGEETNEHTLAVLLALRNDWHDAAASAASADDRDYHAKSLREQIEAEKPSKANVGTRTNYALMAKLEANGDAALEKRMYASMIEADEVQATERAVGNKSLMPTVLEILRTVSTFAPSGARFDHLPTRKQKQLTAFAVGCVERTMADMAKRMKSQPIAFARSAEAAHQCKLALNLVLKAKYHDIGELENTAAPLSGTELELGRNAKRKAVCTID